LSELIFFEKENSECGEREIAPKKLRKNSIDDLKNTSIYNRMGEILL